MKEGFVIAFPTDTVYGIGTPVFDTLGVKKINELKKRPDSMKMAVLCSSLAMIESIAILTDDAKRLIKAFMPGAFTLILKANKNYQDKTNEKTVGIRIPNHQLALKIINKYGPLKTTSINDHGEEPLNDILKVKEKYGSYIDEIYSIDNETSSGIASTVIDYSDNTLKIIREGNIKLKDCLSVLKNK
ncbi:threonylcarbamoyl-AMP synthase [Acholeplasma sp. OttesenSCG-928-E16]|nr:threonylcarbamoyl-AMP synthase [Acholeplasma sp. OttesenSCG-928-E16]